MSSLDRLARAEDIALEHYRWLRAQNLTQTQMYHLIAERPPANFQGSDGLVRRIAKKWLSEAAR